MKVLPKAFQIVRVISDCRLLDTDGAEHVYWRKDGCGLVKGWYVVTWPRGIATGRYNVDTQFRGPFRQRGLANVALRQFLSGTRADNATSAQREQEGFQPPPLGGAFPQQPSPQPPHKG